MRHQNATAALCPAAKPTLPKSALRQVLSAAIPVLRLRRRDRGLHRDKSKSAKQ
jgi:hypothetical protein